VRITVAVTDDTADGVFLYAQRRREEISVALSKVLDRLAKREKESVYGNRDSGWPIAR
jgi:hypothetical protein